MRVRVLVGAVLLASAGVTGLVQARSVPALPATPVAAPATQALVNRYVAENKVPGLVVGIGRGDAPTEYYKAGRIAAEADAPLADENSLWRVYSMTKPITGIAAMILVEEGKLKLDQPISDFIPAFKNMRVLNDPAGPVTATHPAAHPITVRMLLTHTAGLGYDLGQNPVPGTLLDQYRQQGINPAQISNQLEPNQRAIRPASLEAFANKLATFPLVYEPGTKWSYSIGLDLMGRVIEVASGMTFDAFLQKRLFDPLKMKSTFFTVPGSEAGRLATNYFYAGENRLPVDPGKGSLWLKPPSFPYGGAGLVSSAHDYDRFLHMLQNGGTLDGVRVLKPETARLAMSNLLPAGADTTLLGTLTSVGKLGFGAGGSVYLADVPGAASKGTYGWGGAASTLAWVDPAKNVRGVVMVNYMPTEKWPLRADLNQALVADLLK
ncbi:beta-lactamase family protein [Sphingomonas sp. LB-2]|nr:serine hydrolase domain-containing protein [Sphingomonas caeni]MCW3847046.1 beta-lactamase family protein [Sphingomonas caeni]